MIVSRTESAFSKDFNDQTERQMLRTHTGRAEAAVMEQISGNIASLEIVSKWMKSEKLGGSLQPTVASRLIEMIGELQVSITIIHVRKRR